jgi:2-polyprenyl-3-methyl-5-hydroxy-6-metoxy-1,4-benzoquinol methylase
VLDLLASGDGLCLDLGCGSGLYFDVLTATGRTVVGLDGSAEPCASDQPEIRLIIQ